ncbi:cupin domain-containing protein [Planctomycetota bacterium]|nr:cupin domain-containing protein [Planctomycetota bacterium]
MNKESGNWLELLGNLQGKLDDEVFENVLEGESGFRLERIVSDGQASPEGFWYEQEMAEWVIVIMGEAGVKFEDEDEERVLKAGDYLMIDAMRRHRVNWTSDHEKTIWLALHLK